MTGLKPLDPEPRNLIDGALVDEVDRCVVRIGRVDIFRRVGRRVVGYVSQSWHRLFGSAGDEDDAGK